MHLLNPLISPRFRPALILCLVAALVTASCSEGQATGNGGGVERGDALPSDFIENPLGGAGIAVGSMFSAGLPFVPLIPSKLGSPIVQEVYIPQDAPDGAMAAWSFDDPDFGRFVLLEYPDDTTTESLRAEVKMAPSRGCSTSPVPVEGSSEPAELTTCSDYTASMSNLVGGQEALVIDAATAVSVTWIEKLIPAANAMSPSSPSLLIQVIGPTTGLTIAQLLQAADVISKDFASTASKT